jgi:hypothetical protein
VRTAFVRIEPTSDPAHLADCDRCEDVALDDARHVARKLLVVARMEQVRAGHQRVNRRDTHHTGKGAAPELLGEHHPAENVHAAAAVLLGKPNAQEAEIAHLLQELARHVPVALPLVAVGDDLLLDEAPDLPPQLLVFFGKWGHA